MRESARSSTASIPWSSRSDLHTASDYGNKGPPAEDASALPAGSAAVLSSRRPSRSAAYSNPAKEKTCDEGADGQ
jgi:hypothetical protein